MNSDFEPNSLNIQGIMKVKDSKKHDDKKKEKTTSSSNGKKKRIQFDPIAIARDIEIEKIYQKAKTDKDKKLVMKFYHHLHWLRDGQKRKEIINDTERKTNDVLSISNNFITQIESEFIDLLNEFAPKLDITTNRVLSHHDKAWLAQLDLSKVRHYIDICKVLSESYPEYSKGQEPRHDIDNLVAFLIYFLDLDRFDNKYDLLIKCFETDSPLVFYCTLLELFNLYCHTAQLRMADMSKLDDKVDNKIKPWVDSAKSIKKQMESAYILALSNYRKLLGIKIARPITASDKRNLYSIDASKIIQYEKLSRELHVRLLSMRGNKPRLSRFHSATTQKVTAFLIYFLGLENFDAKYDLLKTCVKTRNDFECCFLLVQLIMLYNCDYKLGNDRGEILELMISFMVIRHHLIYELIGSILSLDNATKVVKNTLLGIYKKSKTVYDVVLIIAQFHFKSLQGNKPSSKQIQHVSNFIRIIQKLCRVALDGEQLSLLQTLTGIDDCLPKSIKEELLSLSQLLPENEVFLIKFFFLLRNYFDKIKSEQSITKQRSVRSLIASLDDLCKNTDDEVSRVVKESFHQLKPKQRKILSGKNSKQVLVGDEQLNMRIQYEQSHGTTSVGKIQERMKMRQGGGVDIYERDVKQSNGVDQIAHKQLSTKARDETERSRYEFDIRPATPTKADAKARVTRRIK